MAKFCTNCGKELNEGADICLNCGKLVNNNSNNNYNNSNYNNNSNNSNYNNNNTNPPTPTGKSKIGAGILGILLGCFGVHNFYLGYNGKAIAQLLMTVLSFFILSPISAIWGFIEGILILCGSIDKDANGNKLVD